MTEAEFALSRERFEATAGMDHPDLPEPAIECLQTRLYRWQIRNYGVPDPRDMALGIGEEVGEYAEAEWSRGSADALDAIADVAIYAIQLCTVLRLDAGSLMARPEAPMTIPPREVIVGQLQHVVLKTHQRIRGMADPEGARRAAAKCLAVLFGWLSLQAEVHGRELAELTAEIAEVIMKREKSKLPQVAR